MEKLDSVINSSLETLKEKKSFSYEMNSAFKEAAKSSNLDSAVLRRVKDYKYYKGKGWDGSPIVLDKEEKFKDRVSPTFRKLYTIIDDLAQVEQLEVLDEYLDCLRSHGIKIDISGYHPNNSTTNKEATDSAINTGVALQSNICELADEIKENDSEEAEVQGFGPKKEYVKLINLIYQKNEKGKDIGDKCQEKKTELALAQDSYDIAQNRKF